MDAEISGLWWIVAVVTGAIGAAMVVYAIRQKDAIPLVFGLGISVIPMLVSSGWAAAMLSIAIGVLFILVRKYW
jgi:hypothetical protein